MTRPQSEVADVVNQFVDAFLDENDNSIPAAHAKVLAHILECRTAFLGGHVERCDSCGDIRISYNSCRDRHCPKCQSLARADWLEKQEAKLLPIPYFHVVFTLPSEINALALGHKRLVYNLLFAAGSASLLKLTRDPKRLGADIGFTAVLHTWGQNMTLHPHLHCIVTGGGLSFDGERWVSGPQGFLVPVKVLAKLFRGKFLAGLTKAHDAGELSFGGGTADLADPVAWANFRDQLYRKNWVVFAKRPFSGPNQVLDYFGRYTHRVAISNHRIVGINDRTVSFRAKDYRNGGATRIVTLSGVEFIRRFLLHVLPFRFVRIRHYGILASSNLSTKLAAAQRLLGVDQFAGEPDDHDKPWWERFLARTGIDLMACKCGGRYVPFRVLPRPRAPPIP